LPDKPWVENLLEYFKRDGYLTASLAFRSQGSYWLGPVLALEDFPSVFRYFDLVITGSFHESIFSLRNGIPAVGIDYFPHRVDPESGKSKINSLMKDYGLEKTHYFSGNQAEDCQLLFKRIQEAKARFNAERATALSNRFGDNFRNAVNAIAEILEER